MRKQTQLLLALFVALAAASVMAITKQPERGMVRLDLSHTDLSRVDSIALAGEHNVVLNKQDDGWHLANGHRADEHLVSSLLRELGDVNSSDFITEDTGRFVDLNVEGPRAHGVTLRRRGHDVVAVRVGEATAPGQNYVRQNDRVFRVQGLMLAAHARAEGDWEDRALHHDAADDVRHISIAVKGQPEVSLNKVEDAWQPAQSEALPQSFRFDSAQAGMLTNGLVNMRASQIVDEDPGAAVTHLTDATADTIAWHLNEAGTEQASDARRMLCIGGAADEHTRYVRMAGNAQLYTMDNQQLQGLLRTWASLRALTVMATLDAADVHALTIAPAQGAPYTLQRDAQGNWAPAASSKLGKTFVVDPIKVRQRINQVALARAVGYVGEPAKKYGIGVSKTGSVRLMGPHNKAQTLIFGRALRPEEGLGYYAQGTADGGIYIMSRPLHDNLLAGAESLRRTLPKAPTQPANVAGGQGITPEMEAQIRKQLAQSGQG